MHILENSKIKEIVDRNKKEQKKDLKVLTKDGDEIEDIGEYWSDEAIAILLKAGKIIGMIFLGINWISFLAAFLILMVCEGAEQVYCDGKRGKVWTTKDTFKMMCLYGIPALLWFVGTIILDVYIVIAIITPED